MPKLWGVRNKNGRWYIEFQYKGKTYTGEGKSWPANRGKEAEEYAKKIKDTLERGKYINKTDITVGDFILKFYEHEEKRTEHNTKHRLKNSSFITIKRILNSGLPKDIKELKLKNITPELYDNLQNELLERYKPNTARNVDTYFRKVLKIARIWKYIPELPYEGIPLITPTETESIPVKDADYKLMIEHADIQSPALLAFGRFAGTRISEAVARTWGDIDFTENKVNIHNQYYLGEFTTPKSRKRRFGLFPELKEILEQWRDTTPYKNDKDLIFRGESGKPISTHNWTWDVYKLQLVHGLELNEKYTYQSLRHRFYTWLLDIGFSERDALYMLGDKTAPMVRRTYDHPTGEHLQQKIEQTRVFDALSPEKSPDRKTQIIDIQEIRRNTG